jgi:hypothetical protein
MAGQKKSNALNAVKEKILTLPFFIRTVKTVTFALTALVHRMFIVIQIKNSIK